ncbi:P-loop containing nucleoside triphosphate hydrolase protein [Phlyctochytrium arcticum]|nr:P-loop containing nucleoside triphosphate hydrolase protein [Phlyctochytrium arcticum]
MPHHFAGDQSAGHHVSAGGYFGDGQQPGVHHPLPQHQRTSTIGSSVKWSAGSSHHGDMYGFLPSGPSSAPGSSPTARSPSQQGNENIRVVVRCRPVNANEPQPPGGGRITCLDDNRTVQVTAPAGEGRALTFDRVFGAESFQTSVFEECGVKDMVSRGLDGYATAIFAFGQTGSGKSYTMTGPPGAEMHPEHSGIILRSLMYIFEQIHQRSDAQFTVRASYLEIYNEHVHDLMNTAAQTSLPVRWTAQRGFYVENLLILECQTLDDCMAVLQEGLRNRTTRAHQLNEHSSRSHSMMILSIDSQVQDPLGGEPVKRYGKIKFVDLAGSEKVKESKTTGEALSETFNINRSLLTLGNCISALADHRKQGNHVPYRDSNLTRLLADSLGGHGLALMIACISPAPRHVNETMKTLRYAQRAKRIRNRPVVRTDPRDEILNGLRQEIVQLRLENRYLKGVMEHGSSVASQSMSQSPLLTPSSAPARSSSMNFRLPALPNTSNITSISESGAFSSHIRPGQWDANTHENAQQALTNLHLTNHTPYAPGQETYQTVSPSLARPGATSGIKAPKQKPGAQKLPRGAQKQGSYSSKGVQQKSKRAPSHAAAPDPSQVRTEFVAQHGYHWVALFFPTYLNTNFFRRNDFQPSSQGPSPYYGFPDQSQYSTAAMQYSYPSHPGPSYLATPYMSGYYGHVTQTGPHSHMTDVRHRAEKDVYAIDREIKRMNGP